MSHSKKRRAKGSGCIFRRESGIYAFQYSDLEGKVIRRSLRTRNFREAQEAAKELERQLKARDTEEALRNIAHSRGLIEKSHIQFESVWAEFEKTGHQASEGTMQNYHRALNRFLAWMGENRPNETDFSQIEPETAKAYLDWLWQTGLSASTYNQHLIALSLIARKLAGRRKGMTSPWPTGKDARKKDDQQERLPLDQKQLQKLSEVLEGYQGIHESEMPVAALLGLFAGMRLVDVVLLRWESVNLDTGHLCYTPRKTRRSSKAIARVPILPPLASALEGLVGGEEYFKGEYVLPGLAEHYERSKDYVTRIMGALVCEAAGDQKQEIEAQHQRSRRLYGFHSLRHTFAIEAAKGGATPGQLKAMTGDNIATLDRFYAKAKSLSAPSAMEFGTLPRLLKSPDAAASARAELHALIDELSMRDVKTLLQQARGLQNHDLTEHAG